MANITLSDVQAWLETTKLNPSTIESNLADQITVALLARLRPVFDSVDTWTSDTTTPKLVKTIISMLYVAALYERSYGDDHEDTDNYAGLLRSMAEANILGLLNGSLQITEDDSNRDSSSPAYFPNDLSSAQAASSDAPNDGGPYFTMGMTF